MAPTTTCHLFTLGGLGMGMETGNRFSKTQTRLWGEVISLLHSTPGTLQSVDLHLDKIPDRNTSQPSNEREFK